MNRTNFPIIAFLLLFSLFLLGCATPTESVNWRFQFVDEEGEPIHDAIVKFTDTQAGNVIATGKTSPGGVFRSTHDQGSLDFMMDVQKGDSIWNFHVWTESSFRSSDLPEDSRSNHYDSIGVRGDHVKVISWYDLKGSNPTVVIQLENPAP